MHSDLKPANFLVVEGRLKLIDFGIAKAISSDTTSIARESQARCPAPVVIGAPITVKGIPIQALLEHLYCNAICMCMHVGY